MYYTYMSARDDHLMRVDRALRVMRRHLMPPAAITDEGRRIETSTVLVLEAVVDAGAQTVRDVARHLGVTHSTASRLITRAEEAGMVSRRPSPASARETLVEATPAGQDVRARGLGFRLDRLAAITAGWPPADVRAFADLLGRFAGGEHRVP